MNKFLDTVRKDIMESKGVTFKTQEDFNRENEIIRKNQEKEILSKIDAIENKAILRVFKLGKEDISIDKNNLIQEMESAMVLHSNVIDDIFTLKMVIEEMKIILNSLIGSLHHNLKFKNQYKLKSKTEIDTYIAKDPFYNIVNIRIKKIQSQLEKSENFSGMLKQKIGFIRDLTKMRTQELYGNKDA